MWLKLNQYTSIIGIKQSKLKKTNNEDISICFDDSM